jgi:hypothetical protein
VVVPLDVSRTSAAGDTLLLGGADGEGRGCVFGVDPATLRASALYCEPVVRVQGLAGVDDAALAVLCAVGDPGSCRLVEVALAAPHAARTLLEGTLDGPLVPHDGFVDAVRGEGVTRLRRDRGAAPTFLADLIYAESVEAFWHRGRLYGRNGSTLVTRADGSVRRTVAAVRWAAFASDGDRLWGIGRGDGTVALESWSAPEASTTRVATVPGGEEYALAVTREAVYVASGRLLTAVSRADGRVTPGGALPGDGTLRLQCAGAEVFAVTQERVCEGRGTLRGSGRAASSRAEVCVPEARVRRWPRPGVS